MKFVLRSDQLTPSLSQFTKKRFGNMSTDTSFCNWTALCLVNFNVAKFRQKKYGISGKYLFHPFVLMEELREMFV